MTNTQEEHFLFYVDRLKKGLTKCESYIDKMGYHYYLDIISEEYKSKHRFVCLKQQYNHFLIKTSDGIQFYLDDHDIISMLIDLKLRNIELHKHIYSGFYSYLRSEYYEFKFIIKDRTFIYNGIPYKDKSAKIETKADSDICINDFIHLLNLIIAKESIGDISPEDIVCKYITLAEYYGEGCTKAKEILIHCGFDTTKSFDKAKGQIAVAGKYKFSVDFNVFQKYVNI